MQVLASVGANNSLFSTLYPRFTWEVYFGFLWDARSSNVELLIALLKSNASIARQTKCMGQWENSWWLECMCGKLCLYLKLYSISFPMELLFKLKASETFALCEFILNALQEIVDMLEDFCACRSFQPLGSHSDQLCSRLLSAVFVEVLFSLLPFWSLTGFGRGCLGSALQTSIRC